jgi:hypothetical protein
MGQDPDAIRDEIVGTRERMGETIDALGHKADVKSRAKENVAGKVDSVKEHLGLAGEKASNGKAAGLAQENPLGLAVGAAAVGFLAGLLLPSSRVEDEKLGPTADRVKDQAKETGHEALERGKEVAQSAAQSAADTLSEEGQKHGKRLADSARESADSLRE